MTRNPPWALPGPVLTGVLGARTGLFRSWATVSRGPSSISTQINKYFTFLLGCVGLCPSASPGLSAPGSPFACCSSQKVFGFWVGEREVEEWGSTLDTWRSVGEPCCLWKKLVSEDDIKALSSFICENMSLICVPWQRGGSNASVRPKTGLSGAERGTNTRRAVTSSSTTTWSRVCRSCFGCCSGAEAARSRRTAPSPPQPNEAQGFGAFLSTSSFLLTHSRRQPPLLQLWIYRKHLKKPHQRPQTRAQNSRGGFAPGGAARGRAGARGGAAGGARGGARLCRPPAPRAARSLREAKPAALRAEKWRRGGGFPQRLRTRGAPRLLLLPSFVPSVLPSAARFAAMSALLLALATLWGLPPVAEALAAGAGGGKARPRCSAERGAGARPLRAARWTFRRYRLHPGKFCGRLALPPAPPRCLERARPRSAPCKLGSRERGAGLRLSAERERGEPVSGDKWWGGDEGRAPQWSGWRDVPRSDPGWTHRFWITAPL